jgi:DNA-binding CsgD family transcriptional regulator
MGVMRTLLPDEKIFDLIERIYAAGCDPSLWPTFVDQVHSALPGTAFSTILALGKTTLSSQSASRGIPDDCLASYFDHYQFINPYNALFERFPTGQVQRLSELLGQNDIKRHVFYHEWLKPAGNFTYAAGITLLRDHLRLLRVSLDIPERMGHLEPAAASFLARLGPHIIRAFEVNDRLQAAEVTQHSLAGVIDRIEGAALICAPIGRVLIANAEAEELARGGALIRLQNGRSLSFGRPQHDEAFRMAMVSVTSPSTLPAPSVFRVAGSALEACTVTILPLKPKTTMAVAQATAMALVLIRKASTRPRAPDQVLQVLYGLTKVEAKVASMLAGGGDVTEIANAHSVSKVTVRNQIAAVMGKMGVRRQAEVVALVGALAPSLKLEC